MFFCCHGYNKIITSVHLLCICCALTVQLEHRGCTVNAQTMHSQPGEDMAIAGRKIDNGIRFSGYLRYRIPVKFIILANLLKSGSDEGLFCLNTIFFKLLSMCVCPITLVKSIIPQSFESTVFLLRKFW